MKVWSYAKKRETERRKEDSLRQSRNVTDVRETEKEKPWLENTKYSKLKKLIYLINYVSYKLQILLQMFTIH